MAPIAKILKKQPTQASAACRYVCVAGALKELLSPLVHKEKGTLYTGDLAGRFFPAPFQRRKYVPAAVFTTLRIMKDYTI